MGCDIHGYIERRKKGTDDRWELACAVNGGRNYTFFGLLNNVREELAVFPDRGFPEDASYDLQNINEQWASDGHSHSYITREEVEKAASSETLVEITRYWPKQNLERLKNGDWEAMYPCCGGTSNPDLERATLRVPLDAVGVRYEFNQILDDMKRFPEYETRFVFWFDN